MLVWYWSLFNKNSIDGVCDTSILFVQMQLLKATGDADALATKLKRQELSRKYPLVEPSLLEEIFIDNK